MKFQDGHAEINHLPPEGLQAEFELVAKRQEKSMAEIIRELVESYVSEHRPAKPQAIGIGSDREVNSKLPRVAQGSVATERNQDAVMKKTTIY